MSRTGLPLLAAGIVVALSAGWPLADRFWGEARDRERVPGGRTLWLGDRTARLTVGAGWTMLRTASDPRTGYVLLRGPLELSVRLTPTVTRASAAELWRGLGRVLRVSDPSTHLGRPAPYGGGRDALAGRIVQGGRSGRATVQPGPRHAAETTALGPPGTPRPDRAAARAVVDSIRFAEAG